MHASPSTSRRAARGLAPDVLATLIERGAVRDAAPGTFHRYVSSSPRGARPAVQIRAASVLLVSMLVLFGAMRFLWRGAP